jgi:hypothetical protein
MSTTIILVVVLGIRVLLDLFTQNRSSWILDTGYCGLFAVATLVLLADDQRDIWGYACALMCVYWGVRALVVFKRRAKN